MLKAGDRDLFGHGGGYPGHTTRTLVDPGRGLVVSVLTNAISDPAEQLARAFVRLLDLASDTAAAAPSVAHGVDPARFVGRYADLWGVYDVALLGGRLYLLDPTLIDPAAGVMDLEVVDDHTLRYGERGSGGLYGDSLSFEFGADGAVLSAHGPVAGRRWPLTSFKLPERVSVRSRAAS